MNVRDRLDMLAIIGLNISVTPDGIHLDVEGPTAWVDVAIPTLRQHRDELVAELHRRAEQSRGGSAA